VRRRGVRVAVVAIALAFLTAGCQYLFGFPQVVPPGDEFANPSPFATFGSGRATITVGKDAPVRLDTLAAPGTLFRSMGAEVTFHSTDGWYLRVSALATGDGSSPLLGSGGFLQLDRIVDGQHWTTADPSRCIVTVEQVDAKGLRGHADCKGLRWSDALGTGFMNPQPAYIKGQDPFDAVITFEASPGSGQSG
jgi:hypothetical protein